MVQFVFGIICEQLQQTADNYCIHNWENNLALQLELFVCFFTQIYMAAQLTGDSGRFMQI